VTVSIRNLVLVALFWAAAVCSPAVFAGEIDNANATSTVERVAPAQAAPALSLQASDGNLYGLSEARDKENLVLVFFRGAW